MPKIPFDGFVKEKNGLMYTAVVRDDNFGFVGHLQRCELLAD